MIIYLEGPDGSGKSTAATNIAKRLVGLGYQVDRFAERNISTHPTRPYRIDDFHLFDELEYMEKDDTIHILDRGPLSDIVYRVFDDYKPVANFTQYLSFFSHHEAIIIYCKTDNAEQAMNERGDDNPVALQRHKELTKVYDIVMAAIATVSVTPGLVYDYTRNTTKELFDRIVSRLQTGDCAGGTCGRRGCIRCNSGGLD